jgi:hypothetical protein
VERKEMEIKNWHIILIVVILCILAFAWLNWIWPSEPAVTPAPVTVFPSNTATQTAAPTHTATLAPTEAPTSTPEPTATYTPHPTNTPRPTSTPTEIIIATATDAPVIKPAKERAPNGRCLVFGTWFPCQKFYR